MENGIGAVSISGGGRPPTTTATIIRLAGGGIGVETGGGIAATIKHPFFNTAVDRASVFPVVRLVEIIGSIADHAENAGDMMRAMLAR